MKNENTIVEAFVQILEDYTRPGDADHRRFEDPKKNSTELCPTCHKPMTDYDPKFKRFRCKSCHVFGKTHQINS